MHLIRDEGSPFTLNKQLSFNFFTNLWNTFAKCFCIFLISFIKFVENWMFLSEFYQNLYRLTYQSSAIISLWNHGIKMTCFKTSMILWIFSCIMFQRKTSSSIKRFLWMLSIEIIVWIYTICFYHCLGLQKPFFTLLIVFIVELSKALHWSLFP